MMKVPATSFHYMILMTFPTPQQSVPLDINVKKVWNHKEIWKQRKTFQGRKTLVDGWGGKGKQANIFNKVYIILSLLSIYHSASWNIFMSLYHMPHKHYTNKYIFTTTEQKKNEERRIRSVKTKGNKSSEWRKETYII